MTVEATSHPAGPDAAAKAGRSGFPHVFRIHHLLAALALGVMLITGLGLNGVSRLPWSLNAGDYPGWLPTARMHLYHFLGALVFAPACLLSAFFFVRRTRLKRLGTLRRISQLLLVGGGGIASATGPLLLFAVPGEPLVRWGHAGAALTILAGTLLHVIVALRLGWKMIVASLHPWRTAAWAAVLLSLLLYVPAPLLILNGLPAVPASRVLVAERIPAPAEGTDLAKLPWDQARPLRIPVQNGRGFVSGRTTVTLRAMHDGREFFVLAAWDDATEDRRNMPWERTADGWKRLVSDEKDEGVYYEDKFALLFPTGSSPTFRRTGCATYCHLGGGNPYGVRGSESIVDVWHWKATRTDPAGYTDDKYWWHLTFDRKDRGRYGDPSEGGGYEKNVNADKTAPLWLPSSPDAVRQGAIPRKAAIPCTPENAAKIPPGTIIPGIVLEAVRGDRGDVRCQSEHRDGVWRLYIRRRLDTGSPYDAKFLPGTRIPFGVAAFDHNSKRHAYNHLVYYLEVE
jgi:hypothetical protein